MLRLSTESASRVKQLVDTVENVFVLYKLATIGLLDASLDSCAKAGLVFKHTGNSVFHQLFGVLAIGIGHLLETRFNVRREVHFHSSKIRENRVSGNTERKAHRAGECPSRHFS